MINRWSVKFNNDQQETLFQLHCKDTLVQSFFYFTLYLMVRNYLNNFIFDQGYTTIHFFLGLANAHLIMIVLTFIAFFFLFSWYFFIRSRSQMGTFHYLILQIIALFIFKLKDFLPQNMNLNPNYLWFYGFNSCFCHLCNISVINIHQIYIQKDLISFNRQQDNQQYISVYVLPPKKYKYELKDEIFNIISFFWIMICTIIVKYFQEIEIRKEYITKREKEILQNLLNNAVPNQTIMLKFDKKQDQLVLINHSNNNINFEYERNKNIRKFLRDLKIVKYEKELQFDSINDYRIQNLEEYFLEEINRPNKFLNDSVDKLYCMKGKQSFTIHSINMVENNQLSIWFCFNENQKIVKQKEQINQVFNSQFLSHFFSRFLIQQRKLLINIQLFIKNLKNQKLKTRLIFETGQIYQSYNSLLNFHQIYHINQFKCSQTKVNIKKLESQLQIICKYSGITVESNVSQITVDYQKLLQILISILNINQQINFQQNKIYLNIKLTTSNEILFKISKLNFCTIWNVMEDQWAKGNLFKNLSVSSNEQRLVKQIQKTIEKLNVFQLKNPAQLAIDICISQLLVTKLGPSNYFQIFEDELHFSIYNQQL